MGMVFPAVGRGQLLATGIPQGCGEALQGAGPKVGVVRSQPCTAPSLIGTKNAKGQGLLLAPIPFHGPAVTRPEWEPQLTARLTPSSLAGVGIATTWLGSNRPPARGGLWPGRVLHSHSWPSTHGLESCPQGCLRCTCCRTGEQGGLGVALPSWQGDSSHVTPLKATLTH